MIVERVELDRNAIVEAGRAVARDLCRPDEVGPAIEARNGEIQRLIVVDHHDPRLVRGRLLHLRHPEPIGRGPERPRRIAQRTVDHGGGGDTMRHERAQVTRGRRNPCFGPCGSTPHGSHQRENEATPATNVETQHRILNA